jgi:uncharacterized membrane protein
MRCPWQVIDINPKWRGFDYIMIGDEILVIDPATRDIVAIIGA